LATIVQSPILIDDAIGREVARAHNIGVIGGCGILLLAKKQGLISKVEPILQSWKDGLGYRLSDSLVAQVLMKAGERK
jgi:predicted nucleic acid-binding protein